jgi:hypothetical protein
MSAMDLLVTSLGSDPAYKTYQDGFYHGAGLEHLLNVVETDKRGSKKLTEWMRPRSINMVLAIIDDEMEELKDALHMTVEQVTLSFLRDFDLKKQVIARLDENSPILRKILLRASRSSQGTSENEIKDAEAVRSV